MSLRRGSRILPILGIPLLIGTVTTGFLGMNLIDNPWAVTLPQVAFGVGLGLVLALYFFLIKGWLR